VSTNKPKLGVGMVGYAFMGAAHSQAWRSAQRFFDLPLQPELVALCGRNADKAAAAAERMGWARAETDWTALVDDDRIGLIDICTPGETHAEIAIRALQAGKHVFCEKPLANTVAEVEAMAQAAADASAHGLRSMVGFNYRRVPAIALARQNYGLALSLPAEYLVGCDGGRSLIRKVAGIEFPGWDPTSSNLLAEVEMAEEPEWGLRRGALGIHSLSRVGDGGLM
jgi:hypothetical protein